MLRKKSKPKKKPKKSRAKKAKKSRARKRLAKKVVKGKGVKRAKAVDKPMFEEVTYQCPGCGRSMTVVKVSGYDVSGMLCQRCAHGDISVEEEGAE